MLRAGGHFVLEAEAVNKDELIVQWRGKSWFLPLHFKIHKLIAIYNLLNLAPFSTPLSFHRNGGSNSNNLLGISK